MIEIDICNTDLYYLEYSLKKASQMNFILIGRKRAEIQSREVNRK